MTRGGTRRSGAPPWSTTQRRVPAREFDPLEVIYMAAGVSPSDAQHLGAAQRKLMDLLAGGSMTIADIAHYFQLPIQQIRLLVSDLTEEGLARTRRQAPPAHEQEPTTDLLRRVIDGLKGLSA